MNVEISENKYLAKMASDFEKWEQMDHAVDEIRSQCFEYKIF